MKGLTVMQINDKVKIVVSEPWNFTSSDGDNMFHCSVMATKKAIPVFTIKGTVISNIVLQSRNTHGQQYNIYLLPKGYCLDNFQNDNSIGQKLIFSIIGEMQ
ncbi:hypothetical protein [Ethanoligenens sp.]|uniref:hypothetical protein n=1 Tax=Ethanoligenens sp. TaxID=2099655 RepID=UPI0039E8BF7A